MSAGELGKTEGFKFSLVDFDWPRWHDFINNNFTKIDAVLRSYITNNILGSWENSTTYEVGDKLLDDTAGLLFTCAVNHTSAATGTFAHDRIAHPTYWNTMRFEPSSKGEWQTATTYGLGDFVSKEYEYAYCVADHVSNVWATDKATGYWEVLIDTSSTITAANDAIAVANAAVASVEGDAIAAAASATAAAGSATAAASSATSAGTQATNASNSATAAASSASTASTKATEAANSATAAATQATNAAASATLAQQYGSGAFTPFFWTASDGQTVFAFGQTINPALIMVWRNGAKFPLGGDDYSVTSTQLTTATACVAGELIEALVFKNFAVADVLAATGNLAELVNKATARANLGITPQTMALWAGGARGHIFGLTTSYATATTYSVAAGEAASEASARAAIVLAASITKGLGAWSAGTGNGSLDTGTIAANTWYHIHAISSSDGTLNDVLLSLSATTPTLPSGYTASRRIGSIRTNGSSQITPFVQLGDDFFLNTPVNDISINPIPATATLYPLSVPSGVRVTAHITAQQGAPSSNFIGVLISCPDTADVAPGASSAPPAGPFNVGAQLSGGGSIWGEMLSLRVRTDTSGRIRVRANATNSNPLYVYTYGWTDERGRL